MRRTIVLAAVLATAMQASAWADDSPPANLGNGLSRLLDPPPPKAGGRMTQAPLAVRARDGRVLVDVYPREGTPVNAVRSAAEAAGLAVVTESETALEGFVALNDVTRLATAAGV